MLYEWFEKISFANNWVLPFILMVPVFAWIRARASRNFHSALTVSSTQSFTAKTTRNFLFNLPLAFRLLAMAAVITALARPQIRNQTSRTEGEGIAIVLCIDVSGSMLSKDFQPNRLEVAKEVAGEFVRQRPVDQIGLVVFAGESFTQFPLSNNQEALLEQIKAVRSGMLEDGTLIGEGLATSVQRLVEIQSKSKIIILLTDGKEEAPDNRLIDPITALEITKAKGIKVYTIGMGSENAVAVSEINKTRKYGPNTAFIDEKLLKKIATETGGDYFRARDKDNLKEVYNRIDRLERSPVKIIKQTKVKEEFHWFILAAFVFLLFEFILKFTLFRTFP
jgi:Ca-activated chloride channel family protein